MKRAIMFDLDGTLIDSVVDIAGAVNHVRREMGMEVMTVDEVGTHVGDGARKLLSRTLGTEDDRTLDHAFGLWWEHYREHCLDNTVFYPNIHDILERLKEKGFSLGVVTNKPEAASRMIVQGLNAERFFEVVVGGDTLAKRKPDPEPLWHAAGVMGVRLTAVWMVGDSPLDIQCAASSGARSCAVLWGLTPEGMLRSHKPDRVISRTEELLGLE